jgi:hypothetical protein
VHQDRLSDTKGFEQVDECDDGRQHAILKRTEDVSGCGLSSAHIPDHEPTTRRSRRGDLYRP